MSSNEPGDDCIALALDFARTPGRYADLLHGYGRLPEGVTALLQLAAGDSFRNSGGTTAGVNVGERQQAARFFIEQVLMSRSASHYRVLGVAPTAPAEQIKEHHRLLIRLFHPDRQRLPDARTDTFATRINQAYSVLRSPETRANYDLMLKEKQASKPQIKSTPFRQQFELISDLPMHPPSFITRHRTAFALCSIAMVAALGVMLVYVNRVPTGTIVNNGKHSTRSSDNVAPQIAVPELPPAIIRALAESNSVESLPPGVLSAGNGKPDETQMHVADTPLTREPVIMAAAVKTASTKLAPPVTAAPASIPEHLSVPPRPTEAVKQSIGTPATVDPPTLPEIKPERLRPEQLNGLVTNLAEQYKRGDLENLLALFDASARMDRGDKNQIRAEYGELFSNSESRILHIWDMAWSGDSKLARGEGSFQARVLRKGERKPRIYSGEVTIEIIQRNDRPLIVGLYHKVEY